MFYCYRQKPYSLSLHSSSILAYPCSASRAFPLSSATARTMADTWQASQVLAQLPANKPLYLLSRLWVASDPIHRSRARRSIALERPWSLAAPLLYAMVRSAASTWLYSYWSLMHPILQLPSSLDSVLWPLYWQYPLSQPPHTKTLFQTPHFFLHFN